MSKAQILLIIIISLVRSTYTTEPTHLLIGHLNPNIIGSYYFRQLERPIKLLSRVKLKKDFVITHIQTKSMIIDESITITNPTLISCIETINKEKNWNSLLDIFKKLENTPQMRKASFVREFLLMVCIIYKSVIFYFGTPDEDSPNPLKISSIMETYHEVNMLGIQELLIAIDFFEINLNRFLIYQQKPLMAQTIKDSLKFWWLAPAIIASVKIASTWLHEQN